jgi:[acyl-carrier-protein] S-malonyltransferase
MAGANAAFGGVLDGVPLAEPRVPVIGNVSAELLTTTDAIARELREQMERPVNWTGSIRRALDEGIRTFIELGPGNVLSGLIRRIDREAATLTLGGLGLDLPDTTAR